MQIRRIITIRSLVVVATGNWLLGGSLAAIAQPTDAADEFANCAEIESAVGRLDCYDAIANRSATSAPPVETLPPPIAVSDPDDVDEPEAESATVIADRTESVETRVATPARAERTEGEFVVVVTSARKNLSGLFILMTDTGQRFDQVSMRTVRLSDPPFRATVTSGSAGSYFLREEGSRARMRVRLRD